MNKFVTIISIWLWGGIFAFLKLYFTSRKEIKKAELDSIHLCVLFFMCCIGGNALLIRIFSKVIMTKRKMMR